MTQAKRRFRIPVIKVDPVEARAERERNIAACESNFGMDSETMLDRLSDGEVEETDEILKWMQDYKMLRRWQEADCLYGKSRGPRQATAAENEEFIASLKLNISEYEARYKMTLEEALHLMDKGEIVEDIDIIKWKFDSRDLKIMEEEIRTAGKHGTATTQSTSSG